MDVFLKMKSLKCERLRLLVHIYLLDGLKKRMKEYMRQYLVTNLRSKKEKDSSANCSNWDSKLKHLIKQFRNDLRFSSIDTFWLDFFKDHFKNETCSKNNTSLRQNSFYSYLYQSKDLLQKDCKRKIDYLYYGS